MFKKRLRRQLMLATLAALLLTGAVDLIVGVDEGFSYLYWMVGRSMSGPSPWIGLRDGLLGNLLFFLCAGLVVSVSTWNDPQSQPFVHRLMAMFPRLENHTEWIEPIVSLVKEDASITTEAVITVCFEDYDESGGAYKISVIKEERIVSLLNHEPYEDSDFQIRVSADSVTGHTCLGCVTEAKVTPVISATKRHGSQPEKADPIDFLKAQQEELTPTKLTWGVEDKTVQLPAGMDGVLSLRYWVCAAITEPFTSVTRRPARKIVVKLQSRLPESTGVQKLIPVRLHIKGEANRSRIFVRQLKPRGEAKEVSFSPRRRRPVLQLDFGAPGVILKPEIGSS